MADQTAYEGTPGWESIRHLTREWLESRFGSHNDPPDEANQGSHIERTRADG